MNDQPKAALEDLFEPLVSWLDHGGDPQPAIKEYWRRRDLLRPNLIHLDDAIMQLASPADSLTDQYDPSRAEWGYDVTEDQLRSGLEEIVGKLRDGGHLSRFDA